MWFETETGTGVSIGITKSGHSPETSSGKPNYPGLGDRPKCVMPRSRAITDQSRR